MEASGNDEESRGGSIVSLLGLRVHNLTKAEALDRIESLTKEERGHSVFFVNAHCVNLAFKDSGYRDVVNRADLVLPDGTGMRLAGCLLRQRIRDNVNGTDLFPLVCERLERLRAPIFLLGALPGLAERVADWMRRKYPAILVAGTYHGYFGPEEEPAVVARVAASGAIVLFVAMGVPLQERFISRHLAATGVRVAFGVGGLFDFYSGRIPRAPLWLRRVGLEWLYRLIQEPRRLWRRYLIGNVVFLARVLRARWRGETGLSGPGGHDEGP